MDKRKTLEQFTEEVKYGFLGNFMEGDRDEEDREFLSKPEVNNLIRGAYDAGKSLDDAVAEVERYYDQNG